jgi:hypothetical protein
LQAKERTLSLACFYGRATPEPARLCGLFSDTKHRLKNIQKSNKKLKPCFANHLCGFCRFFICFLNKAYIY